MTRLAILPHSLQHEWVHLSRRKNQPSGPRTRRPADRLSVRRKLTSWAGLAPMSCTCAGAISRQWPRCSCTCYATSALDLHRLDICRRHARAPPARASGTDGSRRDGLARDRHRGSSALRIGSDASARGAARSTPRRPCGRDRKIFKSSIGTAVSIARCRPPPSAPARRRGAASVGGQGSARYSSRADRSRRSRCDPVVSSEAWVRAISHARLAVFTDADHLPWLDRPRTFFEGRKRFCRELLRHSVTTATLADSVSIVNTGSSPPAVGRRDRF